jgi:hypothetical protein
MRHDDTTPRWLPIWLVCASIATGCASSSPPTPPAPEIEIPSPPVRLAPEHSQRYLPQVQSLSKRASDWLNELQRRMTSEPQR